VAGISQRVDYRHRRLLRARRERQRGRRAAEQRPFRPAAECFLVARPSSRDLFICAKYLLFEAKAPTGPAPLNLAHGTGDRRQ